MTPPLPSVCWTLEADCLGRRVHVYDCLDSTNTLALTLADDPAQHGLVILARAQTSGRGQYGRVWQAPPGSSVLMSVLLFAPPALRRPALLTAWAAVSVCATIRKLADLHAAIKWPNDVLVDGKKLCGILIEQRTTAHADSPLATVAGIGFNVTQSPAMFDAANLPDAASLASVSGRTFPYEDVAKALIRELDEQYHRLQTGDCSTLEAQWKGRLGLIGNKVIAECVQQRHQGRLLDATFTGVDLEVESGRILRLLPESIRSLHRVD